MFKYDWGYWLVILFAAILVVIGSDYLYAQESFDPGHDDISIQGVGPSITRCQFSDKQEGQMIKGFKVPNFVENPSVTFEQHKVGEKGNEMVCMMPMLRGKRRSGWDGHGNDVMVDVICFYEQSCTS